MTVGGSRSIHLYRDLQIELRDGVRTAAEAWTPADGRPHPAILVRTPYMKEAAAPSGYLDPRAATARGYAMVLEDVRGTGESDGKLEPFVNEAADGHDSVEWVARQPWCDGRVVMGGMSYLGATQWLAAAARPPALQAIAPTLSSDDVAEGWSFTGGVPELGFLATWSAVGLAPLDQRMYDEPERSWRDLAAVEAIAPWLGEWLSSPPASDYWRARSVAHRRGEVQVPAFITGGWYDIFESGTLGSFARSRDSRDRLVIGPWGHDSSLSHLVGTADLGFAGLGEERLFGWQLDFYDAILAGREPESPRVRAYALGARRWVELDDWPPPETSARAIELEPASFAVDPNAPVPALGGRGLLISIPGSGFGVADQRPLLKRDDVLVAARVTFDADTVLAGPVNAQLTIQVEGGSRGSLWCAILCVEQRDGALHNIAEGVAGAPAGASRVRVPLGDALIWLPRGATLVLLLAGSSFPRWPAPPVLGRQRVAEPSQLELTVAAPSLAALVCPA